jgi:hypothetical protein
MYESINAMLARQRIADQLAAAERSRKAREAKHVPVHHRGHDYGDRLQN